MTEASEQKSVVQSGMLHSSLELLVHRIIQSVEKSQLAEMKEDFHNRLRITLSHPDNPELIEDLWDFFYDWCVFEQQLIDRIPALSPEEQTTWDVLKKLNYRSLFSVTKISDEVLKLKDLYGKKAYVVPQKTGKQLLGLTRGDIVECRLVEIESGKKKEFALVRTFSYHPTEIHGYIKKKVREFRKSNDEAGFRQWLWLLAGMHLKHRFYPQMPIDKIYDDNSRI